MYQVLAITFCIIKTFSPQRFFISRFIYVNFYSRFLSEVIKTLLSNLPFSLQSKSGLKNIFVNFKIYKKINFSSKRCHEEVTKI